jgi:hypothetical protein
MARKSLTVSAVLAITVALRVIPTAQQNDAPPSGAAPIQATESQPTQPTQAPEGAGATERLTITVPQAGAPALDAERRDRQQEIAIEAQIGTFTGWLLLVGLLQALALVFGVIWTRKAANAAALSAEAAMSSAKTAATTLEMSERAWINVGRFRVIYAAGRYPTYLAVLSNSGRTPARTQYGSITFFVGPKNAIPDAPAYDESTIIAEPMIIAPNQQFARTGLMSPHVLTSEQASAIDSGAIVLGFWGYVRYLDVFDKQHTARFGAFYHAPSKAFHWIAKPGYNVFD